MHEKYNTITKSANKLVADVIHFARRVILFVVLFLALTTSWNRYRESSAPALSITLSLCLSSKCAMPLQMSIFVKYFYCSCAHRTYVQSYTHHTHQFAIMSVCVCAFKRATMVKIYTLLPIWDQFFVVAFAAAACSIFQFEFDVYIITQ